MKVVVIAPHPDDETLGVGGTLLKHKENGDDLFWIVFTRADENLGFSKKWIDDRKRQIEKVAKEYGFKETIELGYITTTLDKIPIGEMIGFFSKHLQRIKPNIVYVNNWSDIHSDHKIVFQVVMSSLKTFRANFVKRILMYETITETDQVPALLQNAFVPNVFVDISKYIDDKLSIMSIYNSEVMEYPLPRSLDSIKALARYRGSQIGVEYAEAFYLLREVCV